jgi:hypothetical protein
MAASVGGGLEARIGPPVLMPVVTADAPTTPRKDGDMPKTDRNEVRIGVRAWLGDEDLTGEQFEQLVDAAVEIDDRIPADQPQERDDALWVALVAIEAGQPVTV